MATRIYVVKRYLKKRKRNGQHEYRWALRWRDPRTDKWCCESTKTADKTEAGELSKTKYAEVNGLIPTQEEIEGEPDKPKPTWGECSKALREAMEADNLRPSYVYDALLNLNALRGMFPDTESAADITADMAHEYKRRRAKIVSPWTVKGDLSSLQAVFGKWLGVECGLLNAAANPFAKVKAPRTDEPDVRIVSADESKALFQWLNDRWNNWRLPVVYLEVVALLGWRATETASIRQEDILADGFVRVASATSKTRKHKYGWWPAELHTELEACSADGWAFGRYADELRRLLILWRKRPHHAARVKDYGPARLVGWTQDELGRFHDEREKKASEHGERYERFTLHDFRRTAITGMQMAGVSEKEVSVMVGATPEVIRRHYERLDQLAIAKRSVQRRLAADRKATLQMPESLRARCAQDIEHDGDSSQVVGL